MSDLIERQAAIDVAKQHWYKPDIAKGLEGLPSAQPERKKGKWIKHYLETWKDAPWGCDCSKCGAWFIVGQDSIRRYNFCPNCGAEMRGEEDG